MDRLVEIGKKVFCLLFFALFLYPVLPFNIQSIVIISISILGVLLYSENVKKRYKLLGVKPFIIPIIWFIYFCLSLIYSNNTTEGIAQISKSISIIIIPFVFIYIIPTAYFRNLNKVFITFLIGNLLFIAVVYLRVIYVISETCFPEIQLMSFGEKIEFIVQKKSYTILLSCYEMHEKSKLFIHKVYNSLNIVFLLVSMLFLNYELKSKVKKYVFFGIVGTLLVFICLYQRSVANVLLMIMLFVAIIFFGTYRILGKKKMIISFGLAMFLAIITGILFKNELMKIDFIKKDIVPVMKLVESIKRGEKIAGVNERWDLNITNLELIRQAPLFGHGIGDVQDKLDVIYESKLEEYPIYEKALLEHQNSHNYYAYLVQVGGIIALVLFLVSMFYCIKVGYNNRDWFYLTLLFILLVNLMFENILSRIHGILFYTLFNSIFLVRNFLYTPDNEER